MQTPERQSQVPPRASEPVEERSGAAEPKSVPGPLTIQKVKAAWESIVTKVSAEKQSLRGELRRAMPDAIDGTVLVVKVPNALSADLLKDNAALVSKAIAEALGASLQVRFQAGAGAAPRAKGGTAARTAARLQNGVEAVGTPADDPEELFSYLNERIK